MCENGAETHLAKESFLRFGNEHEPLIRKGGVYFVKVQTVNACVRADGCTEKTDAYELTDSRKTDAYELTDSRKTDAYELTDSQKTDAYKLTDSRKTDAYKLMDSRKTDAYKLTDSRKTDAYKLTDSQCALLLCGMHPNRCDKEDRKIFRNTQHEVAQRKSQRTKTSMLEHHVHPVKRVQKSIDIVFL